MENNWSCASPRLQVLFDPRLEYSRTAPCHACASNQGQASPAEIGPGGPTLAPSQELGSQVTQCSYAVGRPVPTNVRHGVTSATQKLRLCLSSLSLNLTSLPIYFWEGLVAWVPYPFAIISVGAQIPLPSQHLPSCSPRQTTTLSISEFSKQHLPKHHTKQVAIQIDLQAWRESTSTGLLEVPQPPP